MDQDQKREIALDQAVRLRDKLPEPAKIVEAAESFYKFLAPEDQEKTAG